MATNTLGAPARKGGQVTKKPARHGLPDLRPLTGYSVVLSTVSGKSRLTVTLSEPCVIRSPLWPVVDCTAGGLVYPSACTVVSNTQFYFDFAGLLSTAVGFVQVPYQDMNVQNFQGGFVSPGGQWFRTPLIV
jgi:hypothetical protein